jgi:hypothetical protein
LTGISDFRRVLAILFQPTLPKELKKGGGELIIHQFIKN